MKYSKRKGSREEFTIVDLTALIDVVFILLIFFFVTSTFKKEELVFNLQIPQTAEGEKLTETKQFIVELAKDGVALNGKKLTWEELEEKISLQASVKTDIPVFIHADENIRYKRLSELLDLLQRRKFKEISLVTEKK